MTLILQVVATSIIFNSPGVSGSGAVYSTRVAVLIII